MINPHDPASIAARLAKVEQEIRRLSAQMWPLRCERRILLKLLSHPAPAGSAGNPRKKARP